MAIFSKAALLSVILGIHHASSFAPNTNLFRFGSSSSALKMSTAEASSNTDFNAVHVEKTGGRGVVSASQEAAEKNLSLGAPRDRPVGGHFLTRGGVQITAQVDPLTFVNKSPSGERAPEGTSERAIENIVDQLDNTRGVLLSSSYEFPGR